jgi:hypothetical protein
VSGGLPWTPESLEAIWRACAGVGPDFIGPVEPPMIRWLREGGHFDDESMW